MGRKRREIEFLPAVLEIEESPPSPAGRAMAIAIVLLFAGLGVWSIVGRIDVVAVARGKIIPSDHSKVIQPLEAGIVRAIRVQEGQAVKKGAVLVELDPTATAADHQRASNEHRALLLQAARLRALLHGHGALDPPAGADPGAVAVQHQLLGDQQVEQQARLEAARLVIEQRQAALEATRADIARLEATVPILTQRSEAYRRLLEQEYVARMQYLEVEEQRIARVQELVMRKQRAVQDAAALAEAERLYEVTGAEFKRARLAELSELETRAASLAQEVVKTTQRSAIQKLTAPVDGVVQQLVVHTIGGVVTPAQPLMVLVPRGQPLEAEAWVENKDIGFVEPGQPVEVKIDAFPFTRYGTIAGTLGTLSRDAVPLERGGLAYAARVALERSVIETGDKPLTLVPGMAVTVEIKTGQRRLIEFLLSPLLRHWQESARER